MTIQDIRSKVQATEAEKVKRLAKIETLKEDLEKADQAAADAARSGDYDAYTKAKRQRVDIELELSFMEASSVSPIKQEDLKEAWDDISDSYGKRLVKAKGKLERAKAQFKEAYSEMLAIQTEELALREELGSYIGLYYDGIGDASNTFTMFPLKEKINDIPSNLRVGQSTWNDPDAAYYLTGRPMEESNSVYKIVHHHTT